MPDSGVWEDWSVRFFLFRLFFIFELEWRAKRVMASQRKLELGIKPTCFAQLVHSGLFGGVIVYSLVGGAFCK